jgi:hypothetical protein
VLSISEENIEPAPAPRGKPLVIIGARIDNLLDRLEECGVPEDEFQELVFQAVHIAMKRRRLARKIGGRQ